MGLPTPGAQTHKYKYKLKYKYKYKLKYKHTERNLPHVGTSNKGSRKQTSKLLCCLKV